MSAALVWVVLPVIFAGILLLLRRWDRVVVLLGILFSLALALLAWTQPIGETLVLGTFRLTLEETMVVLGRRFVFTAADTPVLSLIYMGLAFWFGGAIAARLGSLFIPVGLTIAALLSAAIAVEPFLFAALLLEMVTILSIPLISPPGRPAVRGALRFLTFQTLAMPLILFTGWILEGIEASPADSLLVVHGNTLLAMGFALLLGIFPFHTWIPMLAEEVHPYTSAFIFYILSVGITFFGIGFLERYAWLRSSQGLYAMLQLVGTLMVLVAGLWAAFQVHLGRMLGFAFLMETGLALLTVSQGSGDQGLLGSLEILIASLLPRGLAFGLWALALTSLSAGDQGHQSTGLSFAIVQGRGRKYPIAVGAFIMAVFSLVGFPLLAGFPVRMALWNALAQKSWLSVMAALIGSIGLLIGGLRALAVLLSGEEGIRWKISEEWGKRAMLIVGALVLLLAGIFPQWFLPPLVRLTQVFLSGLP